MLGLLSQGPPDLLSLTSPDFNGHWQSNIMHALPSLYQHGALPSLYQHDACTSFTLPTWCMHLLRFTNMKHALPSLCQHGACTFFTLFHHLPMYTCGPYVLSVEVGFEVMEFFFFRWWCSVVVGGASWFVFQSQVSPAMSQWVHSWKLVQEWLVR